MPQTTTVLRQQVFDGTRASGSCPLPAPAQTTPVLGALTGLAAADLADPNLWVGLTLSVALAPGRWFAAATAEWQGGPGRAAPCVRWTGLARRARLVIDVSRPVSAAATITTG